MTELCKPPPIFLDRDGTIIEEVNYLRSLDDTRLHPGSAEAIRDANLAGCPVILITNQSAVARGMVTEEFVRKSGNFLQEILAEKEAHLDAIYFCPYHPQGLNPYNQESEDRKPAAGMMRRACREHGLKLPGSFMIGDKLSDLDTGAEYGVVPLLVRTGYGSKTEKSLGQEFAARGGEIFDELRGAISWILSRNRLSP